jgi:hypothetical protein
MSSSFSPWDIPVATSVAAGLGVVIAGLLIGCSVVCAMKGKWWVAGLGWLIPVVALAWPVCAILVAKPGSFWARRWYDDYWMMKAEDRFSKHEDPALRDRLDAQTDEATMSKKRLAVVAGLIVSLLLIGGIVAAVTPTPKKGEYSEAAQRNFLAGCEAGKTPAPGFCHCVLAKTEAHYSLADLEALEADLKRGAPAPARYKKLAVECESPKGHWDASVQRASIASCEEVKGNEPSWCHCVFAKNQAAYSQAEAEALEQSHNARFEAQVKRYQAECARRSSPRTLR